MKKLLMENLGLKISAILISAFLWFFVTSQGQSVISLDIPLELKNIPAGLGIVSSSVKTVNVAIRGQERLMKGVKPSDISVYVDLAKAKRGEGTYHLNPDDIRLPYSMSVANIAPSVLKVKLDETFTKTVTITPSVTGTPEKGFYVKTVEVEPREVIIQGLKTEMRRVNSLKTDVMDISGLRQTVGQEVNIDTMGTNVKPSVESVKITVHIEGKMK